MRTKDLANFIVKREAARLGSRKDPIIAKYRFCNVIRADDRVTKYIFEWAEEKFEGNIDIWFAFVVARLFNNPPTLGLIRQYTLPFKPAQMRKTLANIKQAGARVFNPAYIVSTNGIAMDKIDYVIDRVLTPLWELRKKYRPIRKETLDSFHKRLCEAQGMGSFMAAQVVADLKYFPPYYDRNLGLATQEADDWWTFAASGPGSRRGLNRVMGNGLNAGWNEKVWRETLAELHKAILPKLPAAIGTRLTAQDLQNCLCEFDKYERARTGEGEPKQLYAPWKEHSKEK